VTPLLAQCVMCFRNAEAQNAGRARALNAGIVTLLVPLLVCFVLVGWLAYRRRARTMATGGLSD